MANIEVTAQAIITPIKLRQAKRLNPSDIKLCIRSESDNLANATVAIKRIWEAYSY